LNHHNQGKGVVENWAHSFNKQPVEKRGCGANGMARFSVMFTRPTEKGTCCVVVEAGYEFGGGNLKGQVKRSPNSIQEGGEKG